MKRYRRFMSFSLFFIFISFFNYGTTLIKKNFDDLVKEAELIFIGRVSRIETKWNENKTVIFTFVTFSELEILKGEKITSSLVVRFTGGEVDDHKMNFIGMPGFEEGARDLIFLRGNYEYMCPIVGWGQGRFKVKMDEILGEEVIFDNNDEPIIKIENNDFIKPLSRKKEQVLILENQPSPPGGKIKETHEKLLLVSSMEKVLSLDEFTVRISEKLGELKMIEE